MKFKKIGVVVADIDEFRPLENSVREYSPCQYRYFDRLGIQFNIADTNVIAVFSGVGKVNAAAATMHFIDIGCDCVLNYGLSGGIGVTSHGGFCIPDRFLEHDFNMESIGYKASQKPSQDYYIYEANPRLKLAFESALGGCMRGTAVSGDSFISDSATSERLSNMFGASSCDMETGAIAGVCRMAGVPFCSLRRISDSADDTAIDTYRDMNENEGSILSDVFVKCLKYMLSKEL